MPTCPELAAFEAAITAQSEAIDRYAVAVAESAAAAAALQESPGDVDRLAAYDLASDTAFRLNAEVATANARMHAAYVRLVRFDAQRCAAEAAGYRALAAARQPAEVN